MSMYQLFDKLAFHMVIIERNGTDAAARKTLRIIQVNDSVATLLGYTNNELASQPLELIFSSFDADLFNQTDMAGLQGKSFEGQLIGASSNRLNVLMSLACMADSPANSDRVMLIFQNIDGNRLIHQDYLTGVNSTEHSVFQCREVESALAESEERFRQMAEMTGEWLWEQDEKGFYIYSSIGVQQILGFSQQEVIGKHYSELLTPQDKASQKYYSAIERPFYAITNHYRHKDGHPVITESTGLPIIDGKGKLIKWRGADRDITAKKHFQDALMESEKRIRLIIESSLNAIVIMDSYGIIMDWNRRAEKMFGWSSQEAIGQRLAELIIPERFHKAHRDGLQHFLQTGYGPILNQQIEHIGIRRDGTEFPVELSISPLKLDNSYIFSGFIHDITSRKAAEQQIREAQINLAITQNEIKIAQQIQSTLLPAEPIKSIHFEVTGYCLPADKVGGDYFDYFFRSDELLDMIIADVSGHSIGPSLFMVETRSAIRAQVHQMGIPSETLSLLNNFLYHDLNNSDFFITLFYLQYDIATQKLSFANAGHPPPLWFSTLSNKCSQLDAEGLILGVHENVVFEEKAIDLDEGDLILLYTDGLTEAENSKGEFFGAERVHDLLMAYAQQSPKQIIDALLSQLKEFCQSKKFNDDITLMVFKRGV